MLSVIELICSSRSSLSI